MAKFRYMNFPKTSANYPKLPQDKSKASRESFRLVADFSWDISDKSETLRGKSWTSSKLPRDKSKTSETSRCKPWGFSNT